MREVVGAWITGVADLACNDTYASLEEFIDDLNDRTDMELQVEVTAEGIDVAHLEPDCMNAGQNFFPFPFDTDDVLSWVYHFENDNSIRYEVHDDAANLLDVPLDEKEVEDRDQVESLREERTDRVLEFVKRLLWDRWIDLDGRDLLLMDQTGEPIELTASHHWVSPTVGEVLRPFRPARFRPTVAKLYPDGRLALTWPGECETARAPGTDRPLPDLLIIDLAICQGAEALEFYDTAYEAMREGLLQVDTSNGGFHAERPPVAN